MPGPVAIIRSLFAHPSTRGVGLDDPLTTALHAENVLVLVAVIAVFSAVAVWGFRRRDLAA